MSKLEIVKQESFGAVKCDFFKDDEQEIYMTINQLAEALEYSSREGVKKILERNDYLRKEEFSTSYKLSLVEGSRRVSRERTVFTEDGIYEVTMLSQKPKAREFRAWVRKVVKDIRKYGMYATEETIDKVLDDPDFGIKLLEQLKEERAEKEQLALENKQKEQRIGELKPKADYTDKILQTKGLLTITQIAKDYGMSGQAMNKKLHELGVQYKQSGQWLLYSEHQGKGYTHSKTVEFERSNGRTDSRMYTKWTQKGRLFLYELLKENGILPEIEQEQTQLEVI